MAAMKPLRSRPAPQGNPLSFVWRVEWWCPAPRAEVRHKNVVREAHQQCSETLNKAMLTLLGVALFCLLTALGAPDHLLLAGDSTIKIPFADAPMSFWGFILVAPCLLIVLVLYLHVFVGYWLDCEWERQCINKSLEGTNEPPIESLPALFSLPDTVSYVLTGFVFYWLVPLVLVTITWKACARLDMGRLLMYVTGLVTFALVFLQLRRCPARQRSWRTPLACTIFLLILGLMGVVTVKPDSLRRRWHLLHAQLPQAFLGSLDMRDALASMANLQGAMLEYTCLERANLTGADLTGARLWNASLESALLPQANLTNAHLPGAHLPGATLKSANLTGADLTDATLTGAILTGAALTGAALEIARLTYARLPDADLTRADLTGADLTGADLTRTNLRRANLEKVTGLTQDQVNRACGDEHTRLPDGLTTPALWLAQYPC